MLAISHAFMSSHPSVAGRGNISMQLGKAGFEGVGRTASLLQLLRPWWIVAAGIGVIAMAMRW